MIINISENQSGHEETGSSKLQCEKNNILLRVFDLSGHNFRVLKD